MLAKKLLVNDKQLLCDKQICLRNVILKVLNAENIVRDFFCHPRTRLLSIFKLCASSNSFCSYELTDWLKTTFS